MITKKDDGRFHFALELIRTNKKTGCVFALVNKLTGSIERLIRPNANAFWVSAKRCDLYAINFDNAAFTTIYKFFPFGRSGRWELMEYTNPDFPPSKDYFHQGKYRGPKAGTHYARRKARERALQVAA